MHFAQVSFWSQADVISSVLVHVTVLLAAAAGIVKFQLLHLFSRRYKSELECRHHLLPDGRVVFEADYTVANTGERPIGFSSVSLRLCAAKLEKGLLRPEPDPSFAERVLGGSAESIFHIEAGERSIFTLRTILPDLEPITFVLCQLAWKNKRAPAPYYGLYVRKDLTGEEMRPVLEVKRASAAN